MAHFHYIGSCYLEIIIIIIYEYIITYIYICYVLLFILLKMNKCTT